MKSLRHILVALGVAPFGRALTAGSRLALDQALQIAPALGADLLLFHSTASDETWDGRVGEYVDVAEGSGETYRPLLERELGRARAAGVEAELVVSGERAALGIIRRVLRGNVDLVISGRRGEIDSRNRHLGSVSAKLLRKCPCPVWVVKPDGALLPRRILAATDLTPVGARVIEHAAFLADHFDAELHVVHSFQRPLAIQMEGEPASASFERLQREQRSRSLEQQIADAKCGRKAELHVALSSPSQAILACSERIDPDLVVMGTVSRGGIPGLLLGNTAERLVARLDVSLLTVKPDDFVCPVARDDS